MSKEQKVVAVIQARLTSSRLPGKVLLHLGGKTVLEQVADRVSRAESVDEIVIAVPDNPWNAPLAKFINKKMRGVTCYCHPGPEDEVMQRTIFAAREAGADIVVDVTSDCPLVDPKLIDNLVALLFKESEYTSNVVERSFPDGFDVQVYSLDMLQRIDPYVILEKDRTHSGWNIVQYFSKAFPKKDKALHNILAPKKYYYPEMRLTLDTKIDYQVLSKVFDHFDGDPPGFEKIIDYVLEEGIC